MHRGDSTLYYRYRQQGGVVNLSDRTQLRLTGPDRVRYLNGQVTSDVRKLQPGQSQMACVTTAKGKLCAEICLTAQQEALLVDAEPSLRESLLTRLERYIVADDVTIEDLTGTQALLHYLSPADPPPESTATATATAARRFGREGWDVRLPRTRLEEVRAVLLGGFVVLDDILSELLRIEAGLPRWGCELDENTLPPEAGLDATHIDYHKGCYIGQEVISRLRSVGHVNRKLTGFIAESDSAVLEAGTPLFGPGADTPPIGVLTSAAYSFTFEKPIALGYLRRGSPTGGLVAHPTDRSGAPAAVSVRELPFVS